MVPNLADVFYRVGSQGQFLEELTRRKWLFYRILAFSSNFQTYLTYFQVNIMETKVLGIVYIYTREPTT